MLGWDEILRDLQQNWLVYLSMPLVAATIGYITKIVAIKMMFEPVEFVGLKAPYLGWQGIVPRKAKVMATIACDTMTSRLVRPEDVFGRLDPARVADSIEKPLLATVERITDELASIYTPGIWERTPNAVRQLLIRRIQAEAPAVVRQMMAEILSRIDELFDLNDMVVRALMRDKRLLNRIFQRSGSEEFRFIARSGIYFGLIIGVVQAVAWAVTQNNWVMPIFGGLTGWITDWLALKMIFHPKKPKRYFGFFTWQGLFLKRRKEVAAEYGALIAAEVVTPANILEAILRGPLSDRLYDLVQRQVERMVDEQAGLFGRFVALTAGSKQYDAMKQLIADRVVENLPATLRHVERYAGEAMDLRNTLITKMQELSEEEFEALLRPAFQQDEWILITVGAVLGFLVGELQLFIMLHH
jgi:uncharacterized membrane protein YheB (UPF0754 family)